MKRVLLISLAFGAWANSQACELTIFQHIDFRGAHKHIYGNYNNLNRSDDKFFNDRMSSFVVHSGTWRFYRHSNYRIPYARSFGPGKYRWVRDLQIENDQVSSMTCR